MKFLILDTEIDKITCESLEWILQEVNRDRSDEWICYTKFDFVEALHEWTQYKLLGVTE